MTQVSLVALAGKTSQGEEEEKEGRKEGGGGETTPQGRVHTIAVACQRRGGERGHGTEKDEGLWRVTE